MNNSPAPKSDKYKEFPPEVAMLRLDPDVRLMMAAAKKNGFGSTWKIILNRTARLCLQEQYATKRVLNVQDKMRRGEKVKLNTTTQT